MSAQYLTTKFQSLINPPNNDKNLITHNFIRYGRENIATERFTQSTNSTTNINLNRPAGKVEVAIDAEITTQNFTTPALANEGFALTNTGWDFSNFAVEASILEYSGDIATNGIPILSCQRQSTGAFLIYIYNAHATNPLSGTFKILVKNRSCVYIN